jgi:hypothetical protein
MEDTAIPYLKMNIKKFNGSHIFINFNKLLGSIMGTFLLYYYVLFISYYLNADRRYSNIIIQCLLSKIDFCVISLF